MSVECGWLCLFVGCGDVKRNGLKDAPFKRVNTPLQRANNKDEMVLNTSRSRV